MKKHEITLSQLVDRFVELNADELKAFNVMVEAKKHETIESALKQAVEAKKPLKPAKLTLHAWFDTHTKTGEQIIKLALDGGSYDKRVGEYIRTHYKGYWFKGHHCWAVVKDEGILKVINDWAVKEKPIHGSRPAEATYAEAKNA